MELVLYILSLAQVLLAATSSCLLPPSTETLPEAARLSVPSNFGTDLVNLDLPSRDCLVASRVRWCSYWVRIVLMDVFNILYPMIFFYLFEI